MAKYKFVDAEVAKTIKHRDVEAYFTSMNNLILDEFVFRVNLPAGLAFYYNESKDKVLSEPFTCTTIETNDPQTKLLELINQAKIDNERIALYQVGEKFIKCAIVPGSL